MQKVKITQKEFDEIYDIEDPKEITGDTSASDGKKLSQTPSDPQKEDTTPFLTQEEQDLEDAFTEDWDIPTEVD